VLALPGLVVDRLAHTMANEALTLVEEGTATAEDVDLALRLGMNHPVGPLEYLHRTGPAEVLAGLRGMLTHFGDPRYRPAQLLVRQAAGAAR
jgi:3-hydroxybutyryl-CoA dehydrogenase